jgi:NRAMP (natural resistance-associated macrophage protein)-like metal ion transporter
MHGDAPAGEAGLMRLLELQHHPHRRLLRGHGYFKRLGPGIVTGAADDDPSGIGTYSQVGAAFGFGLLWTTLATLPLAVAVQEATARLGLVTGKGLAGLIRERFARPVLVGAVVLVGVANTFNIGADIGSMAAAAGLLVPVPYAVATIAFAMVMVMLEVAVPYHRYARVLRWLALSLLAYVGVLVVVQVDWADALAHTVVPRVHADRAILAALLAVFGTTISPYLFFWQAGEEIEEQAERHDLVDRDHVAAMRLDVAAGMGSGVGVMFAIMTTAAVTLGGARRGPGEHCPAGRPGVAPAGREAGRAAVRAGIVGTGLLAVPVLAGSTAYAVAETLGWREGLGRRVSQARAF